MLRCVALLAMEVFPPRGSSVQTSKDYDKIGLTYEWDTKEGWHVTVEPSEDITVSTAPGKSL